MQPAERVAVVAITVAALGSWSYSLVYDAGEVSRESYRAGYQWGRTDQPTIEQCLDRGARLAGRGTNSVSWRDGCLDAIDFDW